MQVRTMWIAAGLLGIMFGCGSEGASSEAQNDRFQNQLGNQPGEGLAALDTNDAADPAAAARSRIEVKLGVEPRGDRLLLKLAFRNPYRCHWRGDLFVERENAAGDVDHVVRFYGKLIRGGSTWGISALIDALSEASVFVARAYHRDGLDEQKFLNCRLSATDAERDCPVFQPLEVEAAAGVELQRSEEKVVAVEAAPCDRLLEQRPPIDTTINLRIGPQAIDVFSSWQNITRRYWKGDLYVDMTDRFGRVKVLHRGLGIGLDAGVGICRFDQVKRPTQPAPFRFSARAMRRDGTAELKWQHPGTTEITAVCTDRLCELIEPDQQRARTALTGQSMIFVESDFVSEFTTVKMHYGEVTFDITRLCKIEHHSGDPNTVQVHFNTMNLPIGPRTWARYTVQLHPMPVVPPGAKLADSLWILTNGPE